MTTPEREALERTRNALVQSIKLLAREVEPDALGGERFDLTDCREVKPLYAAIEAADRALSQPAAPVDEAVVDRVCDAVRKTYTHCMTVDEQIAFRKALRTALTNGGKHG